MIKVIVITIAVAGVLLYLFPFARISGQSMEPTLYDGDILLCRRVLCKKRHRVQQGAIYVFRHPLKDMEHYYVIKRVKLCVTELDSKLRPCKQDLYLLGDNPSHSQDSRDYGYVDSSYVVAKAISYIKRSKEHDKQKEG